MKIDVSIRFELNIDDNRNERDVLHAFLNALAAEVRKQQAQAQGKKKHTFAFFATDLVDNGQATVRIIEDTITIEPEGKLIK